MLIQDFILILILKILIKIIKSKLMIMYECQDIKIFLQKDTNQTGQKKFFRD